MPSLIHKYCTFCPSRMPYSRHLTYKRRYEYSTLYFRNACSLWRTHKKAPFRSRLWPWRDCCPRSRRVRFLATCFMRRWICVSKTKTKLTIVFVTFHVSIYEGVPVGINERRKKRRLTKRKFSLPSVASTPVDDPTAVDAIVICDEISPIFEPFRANVTQQLP